MKKARIVFIAIAVIVLIVIIALIFFGNKKDRDYTVIYESEYNYWNLNIDGEYGVIDRNGNVIIEAKYDRIDIPNQDKDIFVLYKDDEISVVNKLNETLYSGMTVTAIEVETESDDIYEFDTTRLKYKENGMYGLLDFNGNKVTDAIYSEIISLPEKYGEYRVQKDGKYGVISNTGVELVDIEYDYVSGDGYCGNDSYKDGGYIVGMSSDSGMLYGYIDKDEKEILEIDNENLYRVLDMPDSSLYLVATQNGRSSIYKDKKNSTDYLYIDVSYSIDSNMFIVKKNKKYGLLDSNLNTIIEPNYDELLVAGMYVNATLDDEVYVFDLDGNRISDTTYIGLDNTNTRKYYIAINQDYMYGVLDSNMEVVLEAEYDYIKELDDTDLISAEKDGTITIYSASLKELFSVENGVMDIVNDSYIRIKSDNDIRYFTLDGKEVDNKTVYLDNVIYSDKKDGKWGFVDVSDEVVIDYEYDEVTEINEYGFAGIKKDGKWGVVDSLGNIILEPTYESDVEDPIFIGEYCLINGECVNEVY